MSQKEAYQEKLKAQLDEWSADLDKLKARAEKAEAGLKIEYHNEIEQLRAKKEAVEQKLSELKNASEDAWEDIKAGIETSWDSLSQAIKSAVSRFK